MAQQEKLTQQLLQQSNQVINQLQKIMMVLYRVLNNVGNEGQQNSKQQLQNVPQNIQTDLNMINAQISDHKLNQTHLNPNSLNQHTSNQQADDIASQLNILHTEILQVNTSITQTLANQIQQPHINQQPQFLLQSNQKLQLDNISTIQIINQYYSQHQNQSFTQVQKLFPKVEFKYIKQVLTQIRKWESKLRFQALQFYDINYNITDNQQQDNQVFTFIKSVIQVIEQEFVNNQVSTPSKVDLFSHLYQTFIQYNEEMEQGEELIEEFEENNEASDQYSKQQDQVSIITQSSFNTSKSINQSQFSMDLLSSIIQQHKSRVTEDANEQILQYNQEWSKNQVVQDESTSTYNNMQYNFVKDFLNIIQQAQTIGILDPQITLEYLNSQLLYTLINRIFQFNEEYVQYVLEFLNIFIIRDFQKDDIIQQYFYYLLIFDIITSQLSDQYIIMLKSQLCNNSSDVSFLTGDMKEVKRQILNIVVLKTIQPIQIVKNMLTNNVRALLPELIEFCIDIVYLCIKYSIIDIVE